MPPYKPNKSKKQQRLMFVLEKEGKLAPGEALGKAKASMGKKLPLRVKPKRKKTAKK